MKYFTLLIVATLLGATIVKAQVGVGVSGSVNASAKLQVDATDKGFLPPRVALTGTTDVATIATPATGLLVFNTANVTGATGVTPGYYFYDGSKWQRLINQQPDATVEFDQLTPTTGGVVFTPNTPTSANVIYVSSVDGSQWTYNGSAYVTYTAPASTPWYAAGGTTDAGSNKTGSVYRSGKVGIGGSNTPNATLDVRTSPTSTSNPGAGYVGIGTTSSTAAAVGAGALSYSTNSGGTLVYSNGTAWNTLSSTVQKSLVSGYFNAITYGYTGGGYHTLQTTEIIDVNGDFNPATGTFTAPRTGNYTFTCTASSNGSSDIVAKGTWEIQVVPSFGQNMVSRFVAPTSAVTTSIILGVTGAYTTQLTANATVQFKLYNGTGYVQTLAGDAYNRFSIVEN